MPGTYRDHLNERARLRGFPQLFESIPELRDLPIGGTFLSRRTAITDLGVAGLVTAAATRTIWPGLVAIPWLARAWREADGRPGRSRRVRAAQIALADLVGLGALAVGSAKARRLVL
jgi:hypothetical protein